MLKTKCLHVLIFGEKHSIKVSLFIAGDHLHQHELTYIPHYTPHTSCSGRHHVFIVENGGRSLHVHRGDTGSYVGVFTRLQLGVQDGERIYSVGCGDGDQLQLLVGHYMNWRLVTYQVNDCISSTLIICSFLLFSSVYKLKLTTLSNEVYL